MEAPNNLHSRWLRGLLETCVLSVLRSAPAYGYDIAASFEQAGFSRPKGGTLYPDGTAAVEKIETERQTFAEQVSALLCHQKRTSTT